MNMLVPLLSLSLALIGLRSQQAVKLQEIDLDIATLGVEQQVGVADEQRRCGGVGSRAGSRRAAAGGRRQNRRQQHQQCNIVLQPEAAHLQGLRVQRHKPAAPPEGQAAVAAISRARRVRRLVPAKAAKTRSCSSVITLYC